MAAREPLEPPQPPRYDREPPPPRRYDYEYRTLVQERSNGALWAFVIVLVLLVIAAATLYATGAFGRHPLSTETSKVNIKVTAPTSGGGGTAPANGAGGAATGAGQ